MSNPNYTALLLINDVSGSMDDAYEPMEKVLHNMLEKQARKLAGYLTVDVGYFDDLAYQGEQDGDPMLIDIGLYASGGTNIYGPSLQLLNTFERRLNALPENEQPGHKVVVWMTDGGSSERGNQPDMLRQKVKALKAEGDWDFAFLGSFKGAYAAVGVNMGLDRSESIDYHNSDKGREAMADQLGTFISMARSGERAHF